MVSGASISTALYERGVIARGDRAITEALIDDLIAEDESVNVAANDEYPDAEGLATLREQTPDDGSALTTIDLATREPIDEPEAETTTIDVDAGLDSDPAVG